MFSYFLPLCNLWEIWSHSHCHFHFLFITMGNNETLAIGIHQNFSLHCIVISPSSNSFWLLSFVIFPIDSSVTVTIFFNYKICLAPVYIFWFLLSPSLNSNSILSVWTVAPTLLSINGDSCFSWVLFCQHTLGWGIIFSRKKAITSMS